MTQAFDPTQDSTELRHYAEQKLATRNRETVGDAVDQQKLLHELQVHQIELEIQNEALREARGLYQATRFATEAALERYTELYELAPIAYFTLGRDGVILQTNCQGECLLAEARDNIVGQRFIFKVSSEYQLVFQQLMDKVFDSGGTQYLTLKVMAGSLNRWVSLEARSDSKQHSCLVAVTDISEQKHSEQALMLAATVYMALGEAVMVIDADNKIVTVNPAFTQLTGYTEKEAIGQAVSLLKLGQQDQVFYQEIWGALESSGRWQGEIWDERSNGEPYLEWLVIRTLYDDNGEINRRVVMFSDITEKKLAEEIIIKQANFDPLTALPNRRLFLDRLQQAIHNSNRTHRKFALMFLDIDHFKDVNDTLGHDIGDHLLKDVAQRLSSCIGESDTLARLGGDEFTLIIECDAEGLDAMNNVSRVALSIQNQMLAPFQLGNESCHVSFSIGITVCPDDSNDLDDLQRKADQAMYSAKRQGRNRFCFFTPAMQEAAEMRLRISNDLRSALAEHQLWVAYQPIVDLSTGSIQKAEALIRWNHPTRGLISPAEFIPVAEDTGLIIEIGEWVFHQAVSQVLKWRQHCHPAFQISVNKSPMQFHNNHECHREWFEYLQQQGLPGQSIVVEITEGLLLDESPVVAEKLLAFRADGIQVSLDDFGTGYSSMSYLKRFDLDYLKIDQTFVRHLTTDVTNIVLCEAMIVMAHKLGMKVIAEGIETEEQRALLVQAGCDYGQGYLFSKPVSADEFDALLIR